MSTAEPEVKLNKADVNYSKGHKGSRCGICKWFLRDNGCVWVKGDIDPDWWCELFKKKG